MQRLSTASNCIKGGGGITPRLLLLLHPNTQAKVLRGWIWTICTSAMSVLRLHLFPPACTLAPTGSEVKSRPCLPPHILAYIKNGGRPRNDNLKNMQSVARVGLMMTAIHHWQEGVVRIRQNEQIRAPQIVDLRLPQTLCKY